MGKPGNLKKGFYDVKGKGSPGKMERWRNSFTDKHGGKLIHVESVILGLLLLGLLEYNNCPLILVVLIPAIVVFVLPILIGVFQTLAVLTAVLFSLIWGFLALLFAGGLLNSLPIGIFCGIAAYFISFRVHKNYSGIQFHGFQRKDGGVPHTPAEVSDRFIKQAVVFCPKCGRRITSADGICDFCDRT